MGFYAKKKKGKLAKEMATPQTDVPMLILSGLAVVLLAITAFNQLTLNELNRQWNTISLAAPLPDSGGLSAGEAADGSTDGDTPPPASAASLSAEQVWDEIAPSGIPAVYGDELGVSYDDPEGAIAILSQYDNYPAYEQKPIQLSEASNGRYIAIATSISCEYCCGVGAIAASDGRPACGCAHSAAMRGLARYLLERHSEMNNTQILEELGRWKVLFFPQNSVQKAMALKANDMPTDYIALSSNIYRGVERQTQVSGGGLAQQVGGC